MFLTTFVNTTQYWGKCGLLPRLTLSFDYAFALRMRGLFGFNFAEFIFYFLPSISPTGLIYYCIVGCVVKHGDCRMIIDEGMPRYRSPYEKGRLIFQFMVDFPDDNFLPADKLTQLRKLLPPVSPVEVPVDAEECIMRHFDPSTDSHHGHSRNGGREAYESDEDDGPTNMGGQRMQCAQS